jgi:maltooligosyltrehalose trehalohydrolase
MCSVSVWAPRAVDVALVANGERMPLVAVGDGYFRAEFALPPDTSYGFSIDGAPPLPDPRSRAQPEGVHGLSRTVDPEFAWSDAEFRPTPLASAIMYELHVGTFADDGTFDGVIRRLPHLTALGVTHIELMPLAEFPGDRGWGYDGVALYAPHHAYGGTRGLKRLIDACHRHGLSVILDVVYNHLGPDGNYLPRFGPYFSSTRSTPWGSAINLDGPGSEPVRRFLIDNALYWLREFHIDGLRLDAIHALYDDSSPHFLRQLSDAVLRLGDELGKVLVLVAESDANDPRTIQSREQEGFALDALWNDDFHHALHVILCGERTGHYIDFGDVAQLAKSLERGFVYDGQYSSFRQARHGRPLGNVSKRKLIGFLQNHDQVGNRALGERIGHQVSARRVMLGAALLLLGPFIPMLFQGEEWNAKTPFLYFTDHQDPALARAVRDGRRREFRLPGDAERAIPDPGDRTTFEASRLNFSELEQAPHQRMLQHYEQLIRLRRNRPEFASSEVRASFDAERGLLMLFRDASVVLVNFGFVPLNVPLPQTGEPYALHLASDDVRLERQQLFLPGETFAALAPAI